MSLLRYFTSLAVTLSMALPCLGYGDSYAPTGGGNYLCLQAGTSSTNPQGKISIRHKNPRKLLLSRRSWNYENLQKALRKLNNASTKSEKQTRKQMRQLLERLLTCYDARQLPRPGSGTTPTPTASPGNDPPNFEGVRSILQANCMSCHTARGWVLSPAYLQQAGLVIPGSPGLSTLYRNLRGNPELYTPAAMPPTGSGLSQQQIATIREWIVALNPPTNGSPAPTPAPGHFGCIANAEIAPSKMKRLSKRQLYNSILDLTMVGGSFNRETAEYLVGSYDWSDWRRIAEDYSHLGHTRLDDRIDESYLEGVLVTLEAFVGRLESGGGLDDLVRGYVPTCNAQTFQSESCRNQFLRQFARRAFRSPLSTTDYDFYRRPTANGQSQASYRELLLGILSAPRFLYHLEVDGTPVDTAGLILRISPREFISRLAYAVWNTIPDEQLVQYAEQGTVDQDPATVVSYVLDQQAAKARSGLREFFNGWWKVDATLDEIGRYLEYDGDNQRLLLVNYGGSDMPLMTDYSNASIVSNALRDYKTAAADELLTLGALLTIDRNANVAEVFRTRLAPAINDVLRRNYNLAAPWDGNLQNIPTAPATRAGILTRSGFLLSRGQRNRIIIRGRRIREDLLCDTTGLPTNNANPPGTQTNSYAYVTGTTQNRVRHITEQPNTQCVNCHLRFINPLGFLLERFDANGRRRNGGQEVVYEDPPGPQGVMEFRNTFDTTLAPYVNRADESSVSEVEGLSERLATSTEMHACYVRNIVRFALNRVESDGFDGCFMNDLLTNAESTSMKEVLRRLFTSPTYRLRRRNEVL